MWTNKSKLFFFEGNKIISLHSEKHIVGGKNLPVFYMYQFIYESTGEENMYQKPRLSVIIEITHTNEFWLY